MQTEYVDEVFTGLDEASNRDEMFEDDTGYALSSIFVLSSDNDELRAPSVSFSNTSSPLDASSEPEKSSSTYLCCRFFLRFFGILLSESKDTVRGLPLQKDKICKFHHIRTRIQIRLVLLN